ncbi:hypothetical protein D3C74_411720 [compost metagenome]
MLLILARTGDIRSGLRDIRRNIMIDDLIFPPEKFIHLCGHRFGQNRQPAAHFLTGERVEHGSRALAVDWRGFHIAAETAVRIQSHSNIEGKNQHQPADQPDRKSNDRSA